MPSILVKNGEVVTEMGTEKNDLFMKNGVVEKIGKNLRESADEIVDANQLLLFPGFIDCHVHFREPGNEEAENMESGAKAALGGPARRSSFRSGGGGVTTVCDMPNTDPPTCTVRALKDKLERARHITDCDVRFFFGVMKEEHLGELKKVDRKDICGVKLYLGHSTGNLKVEEGISEEIFKICAERNIPLVCHCEDEKIIQQNEKAILGLKHIEHTEALKSDVCLHSKIRSVEAAVSATTYAIDLARKYNTQLHIAHLSTADELEIVRQAKGNGLPITCEVSPHHLFLTVSDYETLGTLAKMNPPLRTEDHCEALWKGIADGTVDCIATDHAPHTLTAKRTSTPLDAPSGVPGVETLIPLLLSCTYGGPKDANGVHRFTGEQPLQRKDIVRLCHTIPNRIFKLGKPDIAIGKPTNIILVNPLVRWTIHGKDLHSKCGWTPYEGWEVTGRVERVILC